MLSTVPFQVPPHLLEKAHDLAPLAMAVAGAGHPVALEGARRAAEAGVVEPVLVGDPDAIVAIARKIGWNIKGIRVVASGDEFKAAETAVALAKAGEVAFLMKGYLQTSVLLRAVLDRRFGLRTDRRVSHISHMTVPGRDRVLYITDAGVNVHPGIDDKVHIIQNVVDLAHALGNSEPKVAVLSGSETVNPSMPSSVDAAELVRRANHGIITGALVDGPFGFDNAVSPEAAAMKGIDSPVAGKADILVVPSLESGNFLRKQMVYFLSATAADIVMGARVPIILPSRADPPEARFSSAILAAVVASEKRRD